MLAGAGVRWLRQHCRIVGGMTGCSTGVPLSVCNCIPNLTPKCEQLALVEQKQHKSAGGLPCKLSAEELALVQHQGTCYYPCGGKVSWSNKVPRHVCCAAGWVTVVENPVYPAGACKSSTASCVQAPAWLTAVINRQPTPLPIATNAEVSPGVSSSDGADHVHPPCCQFKHCSNHIRCRLIWHLCAGLSIDSHTPSPSTSCCRKLIALFHRVELLAGMQDWRSPIHMKQVFIKKHTLMPSTPYKVPKQQFYPLYMRMGKSCTMFVHHGMLATHALTGLHSSTFGFSHTPDLSDFCIAMCTWQSTVYGAENATKAVSYACLKLQALHTSVALQVFCDRWL